MGDCFLRKAAAGHKVQRDAAFAALSQATLLSYRNELLSLKLQCFPRIERDALEIGMNVIIMRDGSGAALVMSSKGAVVGVARQADSESAAQLLDDLGGMLVADQHTQVGQARVAQTDHAAPCQHHHQPYPSPDPGGAYHAAP